jgi:hypothetical protein
MFYRSCHFGGPKSTNHIEDNACCKSCPKQVFVFVWGFPATSSFAHKIGTKQEETQFQDNRFEGEQSIN